MLAGLSVLLEEADMAKRMMLNWLILAVAIAAVASVAPEVNIDGGVLVLLGAAAVVGLVNVLLGPLLRLLSLPLTVMTFGLFGLVVNGLLLAVAAAVSDGLEVGGPLGVVVAALVVSIVATILHVVLDRAVLAGTD
jgi:putative membrane protein